MARLLLTPSLRVEKADIHYIRLTSAFAVDCSAEHHVNKHRGIITPRVSLP